MQCTQCNTEFIAKNEQHKYCSNECRQSAFYTRKTASQTPILRENTNTNTNTMITEDVLNRILAERDRAHASEIARLESEHKAQSLEFRLTAIEKKLE